MTFTQEDWKKRIAEQLHPIGSWVERRVKEDIPYLLYGYLCGVSLWPLIEVARSGQLLPAMMALGSVAWGVGGNLLANQVQAWKDQPDEVTEAEVIKWVTKHAPTNPDLRHALDTILDMMETIPQAQARLSEADKYRFAEVLKTELASMGNLPRFETTLTGSGAIAYGLEAKAAGERAVVVDTVGENIITGDNNSVTYILNQYLTQSDSTELRRPIDMYLTWLQDRCGTIELRGIKREGQQVVQLDLNEIYVPLKAYSFQGSRSIELNSLLSLGRRIIITGGPGSGKTTVLLHIAWAMAAAIAADNPAFAQKKLGLKDTMLDELKQILGNAIELVQKKDWFKHYPVFTKQLEEAQKTVKQLAQVRPDDPLLAALETAQRILEKIEPSARKFQETQGNLRTAEQFAEERELELNSIQGEGEKLDSDQEKVKDSKRLQERVERLALDVMLAKERVNEFRLAYEEAERLLLEKSKQAKKLKSIIGDAIRLVFEKKDSLPLPIFIPLSAYAAHLRRLSGAHKPQDSTLASFISRYLIEKQSSFDLPDDFFWKVLCDGRAIILLLDGLDEVPDEAERVRVREAIEELVTGRPAIWVIVTCRSVAYRGRTALGKGFQEVRVQPLDNSHIEALVRRAYAHLYRHDVKAQQDKIEELLLGIERLETERWQRLGSKVERLVSSPLLVRMLLVIHFSERRLPEQRAELYMKATDAMLLPDYAPDQAIADDLGRRVGGSKEIHRDLVQHLAFTMHKQGESQGREISEDELRRVLEKIPEYALLVDDFIALTRLRGTLLEERLGMYRFIHLAFQEFLAARYLAEVRRGEVGVDGIVSFLQDGPILDSWWREPALLVAGYLNVTSPQTAQMFLSRLGGLDQVGAKRTSSLSVKIQLATTEVTAEAFLEWPTASAELSHALAKRLTALLERPNWSPQILPARRRVVDGDLLALLGDPRPGVGLHPDGLPDIIWCEVQAGPFVMGSNENEDAKAFESEFPQHTVTLPSYRISRYPITNEQYLAFVEDGGYTEKWQRCWTKVGWVRKKNRTGPDTHGGSFDLPNHPVVKVTWYEAVAFCRWLTVKLREAGEIKLNEEVTLPSERQWEKAARGADQRIYPWGNDIDPDRANYNATGVGSTSAVGCFPDGLSPYDCLDIVGNAWEWCRTKWDREYENYRDDNDLEGEEARVLRGGSWSDAQQDIRCASREMNLPNYRSIRRGFRVVISTAN